MSFVLNPYIYGPSAPPVIPWYEADAIKADGVLPKLICDFKNNRYAVNGVETTYENLFSHTRNTTSTYINNLGQITVASPNTKRINYNPSTLVCEGLLVEEARTNVAPNSNNFAVWTVYQSLGTTGGQAGAPDGGNNATKFADGQSDFAQHYAGQAANYVSGLIYTISVYAKADAYTTLQVFAGSGAFGTEVYANYNLANGTIGTVGINAQAFIQPLQGGWYRLILRGQANASASANSGLALIQNNASAARVPSYTGSPGSGVLVYGFQIELGAFASSYIPTSGAAVTRNPDLIVNNSSSVNTFASWYNSAAGTLYNHCTISGTNTLPTFMRSGGLISGSDEANRIGMYNNAAVKLEAIITVNGVNTLQSEIGPTYIGSVPFKGAIGVQVGSNRAAIDGTLGNNFTAAGTPNVDRMSVGNRPQADRPMSGIVHEIRYYNIRAVDATLQTLTAP